MTFPAYTLVSGQPAVAKGINSEGLKRRGFTPDQIRNIKTPIASCSARAKRLAEASDEVAVLAETQPELGIFLESLRSSERGLVR